jgi:hypothetical protein
MRNLHIQKVLNEEDKVPFKLPADKMYDPSSIDIKGMAAATKRDADLRAEEERRQREFAANKEKYKDLIARAQAEKDPEKALGVLFKGLVPYSGPADTVAGELVRAMMRILYRDSNDGDLFYEGYGIETCGGSVAYLIYMIESTYDMFDKIANGQLEDDAYTSALKKVCHEVCKYIFTNDSVWQENEDDSMGRELYKVYEEDYREKWEPLYDYDFEIPPTIREYIDAGHIFTRDFRDEVESCLDGNGFIRYDSVEDGWEGYINIVGLDKESMEELENWRMYEDSSWSDYIDELHDEYGDPYEDDDDEDDIDEALESPEFKKGDKVKYHGKVTTIVDIENDPEFGVDYLIVNPNYDGTDARYENIWVGDRVDPV